MAEQKKKYIASCSFGKDSIATILLALEHNEPLDEICYVEVMYDLSRNISAEHPIHRDFIYNTAIPYFEKQGVHVEVLRSNRDYLSCFHHRRTRGDYKGMKNGFPLVSLCSVQRDCKIRPINQYNKKQKQDGYESVHYEGIAVDEKSRLERINGTTEISLLAKYGYTEAMAKELCQERGLLSPIYQYVKRNGCWFCPNAHWSELRITWNIHPEYLKELAELERDPDLITPYWNYFKSVKPSDIIERFQNEDAQITFDDMSEVEVET